MSFASIIVATPHRQDLSRWQSILEGTPGLKITAHAPGLMELFNKVEHGPPNMVLVSADLCQSDDFELIVTLLSALDVRWMMFESLHAAQGGQVKKALHMRKGGLFSASLKDADSLLVRQVSAIVNTQQRAEQPMSQSTAHPARRYKRMILIGASTGGVDALKTVLSHFKADCPPTIVVQHTGKGFGGGLASVLSRNCAADIQLFQPGQKLQSGCVHIIAGQPQHVVLSADAPPSLRLSDSNPVSGHCPSIDKLFLSAVPFASRVVAAVLTGMGRDGADGLLALRNAGARTLAQDEATSVVYGMPSVAWSTGGAMKQVPLGKIGPSLLAQAAQ